MASDLAPRQEDEVLIRTIYSGISRGTEALVFRGDVPPSQYETMRAPFQEGEFPGPLKYGYSSVGTVEAGADELVGREVFCLFPHQDLYHVPSGSVVPLPPGLPVGRAVLGANMETALNASWDARARPGDRIVVIGAGVVGSLTAFLLADEADVDVLVYDVDPARSETVAALGLPFTTAPPAEASADIVVHASGSEAGLVTALEAAGMESTVLELSWYGSTPVSLPLGEAFHSRRLTLKSSQVGHLPPHMRDRWNHRRRLERALELLLDERLDALISGESPFDELPAVLAELSRDAKGALCHRVRYP